MNLVCGWIEALNVNDTEYYETGYSKSRHVSTLLRICKV